MELDTQDLELEAMGAIKGALSKLDETAQRRVLRWAGDRFGISSQGGKGSRNLIGDDNNEKALETIADLYHAASPKTDGEKALVVAYWSQEIQGEKEFTSQAVNAELKGLGHGVANITSALSDLMAKKPYMVIQTHKSGTSQQARKKYKITDAGIRRVKEMLSGPANESGTGEK